MWKSFIQILLIFDFYMLYEEFMELCREAFRDESITYLRIDRSKKESEGKYCILNDKEKTFIERNPGTNHFIEE